MSKEPFPETGFQERVLIELENGHPCHPPLFFLVADFSIIFAYFTELKINHGFGNAFDVKVFIAIEVQF